MSVWVIQAQQTLQEPTRRESTDALRNSAGKGLIKINGEVVSMAPKNVMEKLTNSKNPKIENLTEKLNLTNEKRYSQVFSQVLKKPK